MWVETNICNGLHATLEKDYIIKWHQQPFEERWGSASPLYPRTGIPDLTSRNIDTRDEEGGPPWAEQQEYKGNGGKQLRACVTQ